MKTNRFALLIAGCLLSIIFHAGNTFAQNKKDAARMVAVQDMVTRQQYSFKAQTATPMSGSMRQLTSDYDLQVTKEKIVSSLPYFGRAYTAPIGSSDGGLQFTSKDFEYSVNSKKNGGWDITIKYNDAGDTRQMQLSIYDNGNASLQVSSNNRQSISFNGYIAAPDKKK